MADNKFRTGEVKRAIQLLKKELPIDLANQAQNFFVGTFRTSSWEGDPWQTPQRKIPGTAAWKYPIKTGLGRRTRATLVESGDLRRRVSNSIRTAQFQLIRLVVDLPYAAMHNEGLPMRNGQPMPKRTFMADSPTLRRLQIAKINTYLSRVFK